MSFFSWDKLQLKYKISIFTVGVMLVTYLFYDLVLADQLAHIDELTVQYKSEQEQLKIVETFISDYPNPEQHLVELDNKIMQIGNKLPDNPDISTFLVELEQLSRESGVKLNYLKPTKIVNNDQKGYREYEVEFSISGNFMQNMIFLTKTESGLRFVSLTSVAMKLDKNRLESKVVAKIYSHGVPAAAKAKVTEPKK